MSLLNNGERRLDLMRQLMKRLGVDVLDLRYARAGSVYAGCRSTCLNCVKAGACSAWLESSAGERPTFCPNLLVFERFVSG